MVAKVDNAHSMAFLGMQDGGLWSKDGMLVCC